MKNKRIFLVGADTGGHVVPVFTLAEELEKEKNIEVFVFGVGSEIEKKFYSKLKNSRYLKIVAGKSQFGSPFSKVTAFCKSIIGLVQCKYYILKFRPQVIFLKGNYATIPMALAARILFCPVIIHESDAIIGRSNKYISKFAKKTFVSYPVEIYHLPIKNIKYSGPILRPEYSAKNIRQQQNILPKILILGGSQGAHKINELIFASIKELSSGYQIVHQTGNQDIKVAEEKKKELPLDIQNNYQPMTFIENVFRSIIDADLIVSRASSSIFEYAAFQKATILIPYPYASLDHQKANAKYFANKNATVMIEEKDLSPTILYSSISKILSSEKRKKELAENLSKSVKFGGEKIIFNELTKYLN